MRRPQIESQKMQSEELEKLCYGAHDLFKGYDQSKKQKNIALGLIGRQNHKFWVGSSCGQKLEQFQAKTCRSRIQMILKKVSIGQMT